MKDKWMYTLTDSEIWTGKEFDTKEEVIEAGKKEAINMQEEAFCNDYFQVGQIIEVFASGVDVDLLLENVAENTTCEVGEVGEDYLMDVDTDHQRELEEKLNEVLFTWMKKYKYEPTFFKIENIEKIALEQMS